MLDPMTKVDRSRPAWQLSRLLDMFKSHLYNSIIHDYYLGTKLNREGARGE